MTKERRASERLAGRYRKLTKQDWCVYCGARATTKDHFVPVSVVASLLSARVSVSGKFLIPCCGECNSVAGDRIFQSIGAKRRYIQGRFKHKYAKLLDMPSWSEEELSELWYVLRKSIEGAMAQRDYIRGRISYQNSQNSEPAKLAAVRLRFSVVGKAA